MKKIAWLIGALLLAINQPVLVYGAKCEVTPLDAKKYTCPTQDIKTILDNPNNIDYWQAPACLEMVIKAIEEKTPYVTDIDKIIKSINVAEEAWKKQIKAPTSKYDLWVDRKEYIRHILGRDNPLAPVTDLQGKELPSCFFPLADGKNLALDSAEEIIKAYGCKAGGAPAWCTGKYAPLKKVSFSIPLIHYIVTQEGCLARLTAWAKQNEENQAAVGLQTVFVDIVNAARDVDLGEAQCNVHRACFTGQSYTRCLLEEQVSQLTEAFFGKNARRQGSGKGKNGRDDESTPRARRISSFLINE